jgi:sodium/hydrogen antiporter
VLSRKPHVCHIRQGIAARLALAVGLVGVALRIPREYPRRNWRAVLLLVGLSMLLM